MPLPIETIVAEALSLPAAQRARLIEKLISSLDVDPDVEEAWAIEVERRSIDIERGEVSLVSGPEALARLKTELK
jgi:putative addiction module component (TIGR02574 family)